MLSPEYLENTRRMLARLELPDGPAGCWIWTGARQTNGYGSIGDGAGSSALVHRFAWELWVGPLRDLTVDHRCQVRLCFNPAHLVAVPREENSARGAGVSTLYCKHGHPMFGTLGEWRWKGDRRRCMTCHKRLEREAYARGARYGHHRG